MTEIILGVNEACSNAVEHAYGLDRGTVRINATRVDGSIELVVSDRGCWRPVRGNEERGRGLGIIHSTMDSVEVRTDLDGTEIVMRRNLLSA